MARLRRKRRTREHIIADLSVHHVEGHVLRCGWVVERMTHDYGIDLELFTFTRSGEQENDAILMQVKATERLRLPRGATTLPCRIERSHLVHWLSEVRPVILIVYDARKELAYWLYVQSYFGRLEGFNLFAAGRTITVRIPTANVLSVAAVRRLARFRDTKMRPIPFVEFRSFLGQLGFVEKRVPKGRVLEHPDEGLLLFRSYRDEEPVLPRDVLRIRKLFELRGLMEPDDFDAQLLRTNTPA